MATALEQYVNTVQTLSTQGNFSQLCDFIGKSTDVLAKNANHLDNVLATLDIQSHSLGVLGILCVKYNLPNIPDFETLFVQTQEFIISCNGEHVRYATDSYADLCHKFTQNLVERKQPLRGICILVTAINKIQLFPAQLTSIHADLCQVPSVLAYKSSPTTNIHPDLWVHYAVADQGLCCLHLYSSYNMIRQCVPVSVDTEKLCLLSKNLKPALQFLDRDITDISKEGGHFDARDFLLYYYYGGMIYTALKQYDKALYFFEIAVTTPSMAVSHVMLEAYKKYILVGLILHGKVPNPPKYTSQVVARYIKPLCQPYHDLASVYACNNPAELRTVVDKHQETFNRDSNMGLVKQCITSVYKKNIQRLTKTFLTLSLSDMANRVKLSGPKEAEKYVLNMIEDGEIYATINQRDGMVRFHDNPEKYNSARMLIRLDQEMQRCMQLDAKLKEMDREVAANPQFVQKSLGVHEDDVPGTSCSKTSAYQ